MIERRAARVLVISDGSVLLIKGCDPARPDAGTWWLTPGGGIDDGETLEDAAVREVSEETGLQLSPVQLGPVIATRVAEFDFDDRHFRQTEWFFAVKVARFAPKVDGWEPIEQQALLDHQWWTVDALVATDETLYPVEIAEIVQAAIDGTISAPIELSGTLPQA